MSEPPGFRRLELEEGADRRARLRELPAGAGVAQLLDDAGRSLLIGRPAGLRRWAADQLGMGRPRRRGRPPTDLSGVARALLWRPAATGFEQRLLYERLMARWVAPGARRDLRTPWWLHLDPAERFPRLVPRSAPAGPGALCGPFASREEAVRARDRLHRLYPLRPCEVDFEPHPELPLGLGCLHAQLRTCAAPCLERVPEAGYRELAAEAGRFLASPSLRPPDADAGLPRVVADARARAVVVEVAGELHHAWPVRGWSVLDAGAARAAELDEALAALSWTGAGEPLSDAAWLLDWLRGKRRGVLCLHEDASAEALARRVRESLAGSPGPRDNVGPDQS